MAQRKLAFDLAEALRMEKELRASTPEEIAAIAADERRADNDRSAAIFAIRNLKKRPGSVISALLKCLLSDKPLLVWDSARTLSHVRPSRYWKRLVDVVEEQPRHMAGEAALYALSFLRGTRIRQVLTRYAVDERLTVSRSGKSAAGRYGGRSSRTDLGETTRDRGLARDGGGTIRAGSGCGRPE